MGVVPQLDNLDVDVTVEENLAVFARLYRVADVGAAVDRALELARLTERRRDAVDELSGGMRRRLLLARGLVHEPRLVLLDEPTVGLDPQIRTQIWSLIDDLRTRGATILMSTHYIEEAERLADEVAVMAAGKVVARGTPGRADRRARRARDRRGLRAAGPARRGAGARRVRRAPGAPGRPGDRDRRLRALDQRHRPRRRGPPGRLARGRLRDAHRGGGGVRRAAQPSAEGIAPRIACAARAGRDRRRDEPRGRELPHLLEGDDLLEPARADDLPARLRARARARRSSTTSTASATSSSSAPAWSRPR